jgi:hypothetical protein
MIRSLRFRQPAYLPAGAVLSLLTLALIAPPGAEGGCSHLVTSRTDLVRLSSLIEPLINDLAGRSDRLPGPQTPRPCSGMWCSGQPAVPPVPAGVFDELLDSWPMCPSASASGSASPTFLSAATTALRPVHQGSGVFHPPRLFLSA